MDRHPGRIQGRKCRSPVRLRHEGICRIEQRGLPVSQLVHEERKCAAEGLILSELRSSPVRRETLTDARRFSDTGREVQDGEASGHVLHPRRRVHHRLRKLGLLRTRLLGHPRRSARHVQLPFRSSR